MERYAGARLLPGAERRWPGRARQSSTISSLRLAVEIHRLALARCTASMTAS